MRDKTIQEKLFDLELKNAKLTENNQKLKKLLWAAAYQYSNYDINIPYQFTLCISEYALRAFNANSRMEVEPEGEHTNIHIR